MNRSEQAFLDGFIKVGQMSMPKTPSLHAPDLTKFQQSEPGVVNSISSWTDNGEYKNY